MAVSVEVVSIIASINHISVEVVSIIASINHTTCMTTMWGLTSIDAIAWGAVGSWGLGAGGCGLWVGGWGLGVGCRVLEEGCRSSCWGVAFAVEGLARV